MEITTDPTSNPTRSLQCAHCDLGFYLDVVHVLLVDYSCAMSEDECYSYSESIKGEPSPRVVYISFSDTQTHHL